jgi:hypothetical protein
MSRIAEGVSQMTEGASPRRKAQSFQAPLWAAYPQDSFKLTSQTRPHQYTEGAML